jgi:antitoxin component YwqK of YwqJK toxin-antitoxin module
MSSKDSINTSYYRNKKGLNELPNDILNKIINVSNYEDSININYLDRDLNSRYPKSYLQSISKVKEPHGIIRTYYDNKKTQLNEVINYRNGVKHGKYLKYYKLKNRKSKLILEQDVNYKDGKLDGENLSYYDNGQLESFSLYKENREIYNIAYDESGDKICKRIYTDDYYDSIVIDYTEMDDDEILITSKKDNYTKEETWKHGKLSLNIDEKIINGVRHEKITKYYPNGTIKEENNYLNGVLVHI